MPCATRCVGTTGCGSNGLVIWCLNEAVVLLVIERVTKIEFDLLQSFNVPCLCRFCCYGV